MTEEVTSHIKEMLSLCMGFVDTKKKYYRRNYRVLTSRANYRGRNKN